MSSYTPIRETEGLPLSRQVTRAQQIGDGKCQRRQDDARHAPPAFKRGLPRGYRSLLHHRREECTRCGRDYSPVRLRIVGKMNPLHRPGVPV